MNVEEGVMANSYKIIDEGSWERAMHCMIFRKCVEPMFCVTFESDKTYLRNEIKTKVLSAVLVAL